MKWVRESKKEVQRKREWKINVVDLDDMANEIFNALRRNVTSGNVGTNGYYFSIYGDEKARKQAFDVLSDYGLENELMEVKNI